MSDRDGSGILASPEVSRLNAEIDRLNAHNAALRLQQELLGSWIVTARMTTATGLVLRALTQQILEALQSLCQAEQGSIFLLDEHLQATECLLARGSTIREQKREIVNQILKEGLAAWTIQHRQIAIVMDTMTDERWLQLPNQPYTVRSALCIPIQRGKRLLALATLMHSQPHHFTPLRVEQAQFAADAIALNLENALLYDQLTSSLNESKEDPLSHEAPSFAGESNAVPSLANPFEDSIASSNILPSSIQSAVNASEARGLEETGLYITTAEGRLRYVNRCFAQIFGYRRRELARVESILDLIPVDYQAMLVHKLEDCIRDNQRPLSCLLPGLHRSGRLIGLDLYGERIHFSGEPGVIGMVRRVDSSPYRTGNTV